MLNPGTSARIAATPAEKPPAKPSKLSAAVGHAIGVVLAAYIVLVVLGAMTLAVYLLARLAMSAT